MRVCAGVGAKMHGHVKVPVSESVFWSEGGQSY